LFDSVQSALLAGVLNGHALGIIDQYAAMFFSREDSGDMENWPKQDHDQEGKEEGTQGHQRSSLPHRLEWEKLKQRNAFGKAPA